MVGKPKLGRPKKNLSDLLIEMARHELRAGSAETPTGLARLALEQYPAEDRPDGNRYRQVRSEPPTTEDYLIGKLRKQYQRDRPRLLFKAQTIDDARRSGQQSARRALQEAKPASKHLSRYARSLGSLNGDLLKQLLDPALLERRAEAFLRGREDIMRRRRSKP